MRGFVCFSIFDWWYHGRGHSDFQLMLQIAEDRPVLLVNSIGMRVPMPGRSPRVVLRLTRKARSTLHMLRRPVPELPAFGVLSPLAVPAYRNARLRGANAALVAAQVRLAMRRIGVTHPVVVVTVPTALTAARMLRPSLLVYNRSDKHSAFTEAHRETIEALESDLLASADIVCYANEALMREEADRVGDRALFLDHGVELDAFAHVLAVPRDLAAIAPPRIGFFGDLRERVIDIELLRAVATQLPDVQLVLAGSASSRIESLRRLKNVHWLGFRDYAEIPALLQSIDVGLLPYRATEWVRYVNPVKLKEYLAAGLPVVSTDFPAARRYPTAVSIADGPSSFVAAVRAALDSPEPREPARRRRQLLVAGASWQRQANLLLSACEQRSGH